MDPGTDSSPITCVTRATASPPQTSLWLPNSPRPRHGAERWEDSRTWGGSKCQLLFLLWFLRRVSWTQIILSLQRTFDGTGRGWFLSPAGGFSLLTARLPGHPQHRAQCRGHATGWSSGWGATGDRHQRVPTENRSEHLSC